MTHRLTGQLIVLMVQHIMTGQYKTTLLLHIDSPWRTSTSYHSLSPRVNMYTAKQICLFWSTVVFSGLASNRPPPLILLHVYLKQNGEKFPDLGDRYLNRHTSALTECTDWSAVFKFRRSSRSLDQLMKTAI